MKAVILAAGIGHRLGDLGKTTPKCLIKIGKETILERNISLLERQGIAKQDMAIVIGGKGEMWTEENQDKIKSMHSNVIVNNENVEKNQAYSFWLGTRDIDDDLACIDGDSVFNEKALEKVVKSEYGSCFLTRIVPSEKRARVLVKNNRVFDIGKEVISDRVYTPILKFSRVFLDALKKEIESKKEIYFSESIIPPMVAICQKHKIFNINLEGTGEDNGLFVNINTPEEYNKAVEVFGGYQ